MATPCSARLLQTFQRPHTRLCYIDVLKDNQVVATFAGNDPNSDLWLLDGSIAVGAGSTIRRQANSITLLDRVGIYVPKTPDDLLAPYITELRIWVGARYWDAPEPAFPISTVAANLQPDTEFVPVGTLVITGISGDFPQITLTCQDRAWYLSNFVSPYAIAAGTNCTDALNSLLGLKIPGSVLVTNIPATEATTAALTYDANSSSQDPYNTIANSAGWMLYPDPMGIFTAVPQPATNDDPVLTITPGGGWLIGHPKPNLGNQDPVNAVVYTSEGVNATTSLRGYAEDDDPSSFTYAGRIGVRPEFDSSPLMTTQDMVNAAAKTRLQNVLGIANTLVVTTMPNPTVEPGDVWHVQDPAQAMDQVVLTDSFTLNLRAATGAQDNTCRANVLR